MSFLLLACFLQCHAFSLARFIACVCFRNTASYPFKIRSVLRKLWAHLCKIYTIQNEFINSSNQLYGFNCPIIKESNGSFGMGKRHKTFIVLIASIQYIIISLSLDFIFIFHRIDRIWIKCYIQHCSNDDYYWSLEFQDIKDSSRILVYFLLPCSSFSSPVSPNKWNE